MKLVLLDADGDPAVAVQRVSPRGVPLCVACGSRVPSMRRRWSKRVYFCSDRCGVAWAEWAANQTVEAAANADYAGS